jgi:hypothetical protein
MRRFLGFTALFLFVFAPIATADGGGPSPGVLEGAAGVGGPGVNFVTVGDGTSTVLERVDVTSATVTGWVNLRGDWGVPTVAFDGTTGGLSTNGRSLVLGEQAFGYCHGNRCSPLRRVSRFIVYDPRTLRHRATISLQGDFSYDALSPDGRMLYVIQHVSSTNLTRYLVRAYDLERRQLRPGAIADRAQRDWVMQGSPVTRVTTSDGDFVYTLYQNPGGYPFVHVLDAVNGTAHCVGLPWAGDQSLIGLMKMTLRDGGRTLAIALPWTPRSEAPKTLPSFSVDTHTYAVSKTDPPSPRSFRWWIIGFAVVPLGIAAVLLRRRMRGVVRDAAAVGV